MKKSAVKKSYQDMIDWNIYRLDQNQKSLAKLVKLLPKLEATQSVDPLFQADFDDLLSLKIIYETGIRNFESKVEKYKELLSEVDNENNSDQTKQS